ncbi:MAG: hypothetical protein H9Q66_04670 [Spiroplasma ixodetis]|nr:hypothetical protein [Spiroplasma ixodetis]
MELENDFAEKAYGNATSLRKNEILAKSTQHGQIKRTPSEKWNHHAQIRVVWNAPQNLQRKKDLEFSVVFGNWLTLIDNVILFWVPWTFAERIGIDLEKFNTPLICWVILNLPILILILAVVQRRGAVSGHFSTISKKEMRK